MSEGERKSFADFIAGSLAEAAKKQERAHTHAEEFGRALRDEIEAAVRAGACESCISNELVRATAERLIGAQPLAPLENLVAAVEGTSKQFAVAMMAALIRREAKAQAAPSAPAEEIKIGKT